MSMDVHSSCASMTVLISGLLILALVEMVVNQTVCEKRGDVDGECERLRLLV